MIKAVFHKKLVWPTLRAIKLKRHNLSVSVSWRTQSVLSLPRYGCGQTFVQRPEKGKWEEDRDERGGCHDDQLLAQGHVGPSWEEWKLWQSAHAGHQMPIPTGLTQVENCSTDQWPPRLLDCSPQNNLIALICLNLGNLARPIATLSEKSTSERVLIDWTTKGARFSNLRF